MKYLILLTAMTSIVFTAGCAEKRGPEAPQPPAKQEAEPIMAPAITEPPLTWVVPDSFDPNVDGMGLEQLQGTELSYIYDPLVCHADPSEGGDGHYESVMHGTYNHHQQFAILDDYVVVFWTNHVRGENGPGQRLMARVGRFNEDGSDIEWGDPNDIIEMAPPAQAAARRPVSDDGDTITGIFLDGNLTLTNGRIFVRGRLMLCDGWTDSMLYHHSPNTKPVPDEHYNKTKTKDYRFDIYWYITSFIQEWKLVDGRLIPASDVYISGPAIPEGLQVTPSIYKKMGTVNEPYASAKPVAEAPEDFKKGMTGEIKEALRRPKYAPGTDKIAADGINGLAHWTEFIRPDGKYVVVRDNLLAPETYYASIKDNAEQCYPPAVKTNLFGVAMPVSGELPDGTVWFVGSDMKRENAYITWSKDGIIFDKTKLLLFMRFEGTPGLHAPKAQGAQYFQTMKRGNTIWLVFSVAKQKIGLLKIPFDSLK